MSDIMELIRDFKEGKVSAVSQHKLRNENIQERNKTKKLRNIKKDSQLKEKLLFLTELAIPFNPATGEEDELYNRDQKFRPLQSQTTVMLMVKGLANESEKAKEVFMKKAGVTEWDTSDLENVTSQDREVLKRYRVPRLFTLPVCQVNIPAFTGNAFGKQYLMEVVRDETTGEIQGEMPLLLQVNKLMSDMAYEELNAYEQAIKDGKINPTDKEKEQKKKDVWGKVVVSGDYPLNYGMAVEIKLDAQSGIANPNEITEVAPEDLFESLVLVKRSKEVKQSLEKYTSGTYKAIDRFDDFYEFDMICPKESDPAQLGLGTRYEKPTVNLYEAEGVNLPDYIASVRKTIDNSDTDWEKIFLKSAYISRFNETLEDNFLKCVSKVIDINDEFLTNRVVLANSSIISLIFGEEGDDKIAAASMGEGKEGNLDETAAQQASRQNTLDLSQIANNQEENLTEVDLDLGVDGDGEEEF